MEDPNKINEALLIFTQTKINIKFFKVTYKLTSHKKLLRESSVSAFYQSPGYKIKIESATEAGTCTERERGEGGRKTTSSLVKILQPERS